MTWVIAALWSWALPAHAEPPPVAPAAPAPVAPAAPEPSEPEPEPEPDEPAPAAPVPSPEGAPDSATAPEPGTEPQAAPDGAPIPADTATAGAPEPEPEPAEPEPAAPEPPEPAAPSIPPEDLWWLWQGPPLEAMVVPEPPEPEPSEPVAPSIPVEDQWWLWQGPPLEAMPPLSSPPGEPGEQPPISAPPVAPSAHALEVIADRLAREADALRNLLSTGTLAWLLLTIGAGTGVYLVALRLARMARDAGYDLDRRMVGIRVLVATSAALWVCGLAGRQLVERMPLIGTALVSVFFAGVLLLLARQAVAAVGGMLVMLGAKVREGDRLTVGDITGVVEHAGIFRVRLHRADGSTVYLPAHSLDDRTVIVSSPRRVQTVRVRLAEDDPIAADRNRLRRIAILCPYRQGGSDVRVERPDGEHGIEIRIQAWSASAAVEAERWLRHALRAPAD